MGLPVLVPTHPAVHADDDEKDLAAGLAPQVKLLGGVECAANASADGGGGGGFLLSVVTTTCLELFLMSFTTDEDEPDGM